MLVWIWKALVQTPNLRLNVTLATRTLPEDGLHQTEISCPNDD
jgi:hypothetical protein